jgi:hypothetical protein
MVVPIGGVLLLLGWLGLLLGVLLPSPRDSAAGLPRPGGTTMS